MQQILVYADSLSWGIIPNSRQRLPFDQRWPGVLELTLNQHKGSNQFTSYRVIEDCLNGRRTVFEDPYKAGRNGLQGLAQRIEIHSPLALVILMLGTNDFQSMHPHQAWHATQGMASLIQSVRTAPVEPGMPIPPILVIAPPVITQVQGNMTDKFAGAAQKCLGLAEAYRSLCTQLDCAFFDAGAVVQSSRVDGVHLDSDAHMRLGRQLAQWLAGQALLQATG